MRFIENWPRLALRLNSVQWSLVWSAAITTWLLLPDADKALLIDLLPLPSLGGKGPALLVLVGFVGGIVARLRAQPALTPEQPPNAGAE